MATPLFTFLNEKAQILESERIKNLRLSYLYKIVRLISVLLKLAMIVIFIINLIIPVFVIHLIIGGVLFILLSLFKNPKEVFETRLKTEILPEVFKFVNTTFEYKASSYNLKTLEESEILEKGIFQSAIDIEGDDYVRGKRGTIDMEFFKIKLYNKKLNYPKTAAGCIFGLFLIPYSIIRSIFHGDGDDYLPDDSLIFYDDKIFFSGLFMHADFNRHFQGKIILIPKKADYAKSVMAAEKLSQVNVSNSYINGHYNIYTSNINLVNLILTQSLTVKIENIFLTEKVFPSITFIEGKMYFATPCNKDFFQVSLNKKIANGDYFIPYLKEVEEFEEIVKELNFKDDIWNCV